jgi:flotillin
MDSLLTAGGLVIGIGIAAVIVLIALITILRSIKVAKPNEAIIVTSKQKHGPSFDNADPDDTSRSETEGQRVVFGSRVFVKPFIEGFYRLSLSSRQLDVTASVQTKDAVTIQVKAVAVVKVGGTERAVRAAAQRFLDQQDQIERSTEEVLSGSVRAIVGQLTVQEIITNRTTLQSRVFEEVKEALGIQGLTIDTLQIKEISDANNYIVNLGRAEAARVRQDAEIAEAKANQASEEARIQAEQAIADQQKELDLRKAAIQRETDKARAEAEQAKPLADAIAQQDVIAQQELTQQRRTALKKQELESDVNAVADAAAYKLKVEATANAEAAVKTAEAERDKRRALAEATLSEAEAEAKAIELKGTAEAEATEKKTKALEKSDAYLREKAISILPDLVREAAAPLAAISNMTVISSDGDGAGQVAGSVPTTIATTTQLLKDLTGIDVNEIITGRATGNAIGEAIAVKEPRIISTPKVKPQTVTPAEEVPTV